MPATDGTWRVASREVVNGRLIGRTAVVSVVFVLALGAFLVVRRVTGAIMSPMPPLPLVATAAALVAWGLFFHLARRTLAGELRSPNSLFTRSLPPLAMTLFAVACSYPGDRWIDWLTWVPAIVVVGWSPQLLCLMRRGSAIRSSPASPVTMTADQELQQITRYRSADGKQSIRGTFLAEFGPTERNATLYIAFCPPFERLPNVELEVADDSSAAVKLAQLLHNGAQIDVRLPRAADQTQCVTLEFVATEAMESED